MVHFFIYSLQYQTNKAMFVFAVIAIAIALGIAYIAGYFKKKPGEKYPGENVPEEGSKA